jgi:hypothetical protein
LFCTLPNPIADGGGSVDLLLVRAALPRHGNTGLEAALAASARRSADPDEPLDHFFKLHR